MNTLFKLYMQAWVMLAISAAVSLNSVLVAFAAELRREAPSTHHPTLLKGLRLAFISGFSICLGLSALYPAFAIPAKSSDRYVASAPQGLDGDEYMRFAKRLEGLDGKQPREFPLRYDYDAIQWLRQNVDGSPTILEGTTAGSQYRWGGRMSIYTGLPSVIGWEWHQRQQRGALDDRVVFDRTKDSLEFYNTIDPNRARLLINRYNISYVVYGEIEKAYHDAAGSAKFKTLVDSGFLSIAFVNDGVVIYEVMKHE